MPPSNVIAAYGFDDNLSEESLWDIFGGFGAIKGVAMVKDPIA